MKGNKPNSAIHPSRRDFFAAMAGLATMGVPRTALADTWPDRPGRIVVAYSPGTSTDTFARGVANEFQNRYSRPFVVDNRPGASGWTGTLAVSQSKPDGHVLTVNANGIAIYGLVQKNGFDATTDLTPIAMIAGAPVALLVTSSLPVKSLTEFVAYAKARPNEILYGSSGVGSAVHLYSEMFNQRAGIQMKHIPYRGLGAALPDFIAGRIHIIFSSYATGAGMIDGGQARLLAYAADGGPQDTPKAPTVRESGIDYEASNWWALFGPPKMPIELQEKINAATNAATNEPGLKKILQSAGVSANPMALEQFRAEVQKQYTDLKAVVDSAHIEFE